MIVSIKYIRLHFNMNRRVIYRDLWQLVLDQSEQQACCDVTHDLQLEESKDHYVVVSVSAMVDLADLWTPGRSCGFW